MRICNKITNCFSIGPANPIRPIVRDLYERLLFLGLFCRHRSTVGAITPSSKALSREITSYIPEKENTLLPQYYLEIGPGTGSFTTEIVKKMRECDRLDVVELLPDFVKKLKKDYLDRKNVHIHCCSILEWESKYQYDVTVSGLPLNAFDSKFVKDFIAKVKSLSKPNGKVSYFEYPTLASSKIKCLALSDKCRKRKDKEKFEQLLAIKKAFYKSHGIKKTRVKQKPHDALVSHFSMEPKDVEKQKKPVHPLSVAA